MTSPPQVTAEYMRSWGKHTHGSPLYAELVEVVANDPELLRVMNRVEHRPPPNLVFAGVQVLLMDGADAELARFYRSIVADPLPPEGVGPSFRRFVLEHEDEIVEIGSTRYTQTNEVRRSVALLPMVMMAPFERFHLIDVGTSAGLNLGLDRYHYQYDGQEWGPASPVLLTAESRGAPLPVHDIDVLSRTGLDLNPLDPRDEETRRWLLALIWPEQEERRERLRHGLEVVSGIPITKVAGDALDTLPQALDDLPEGEPVVIMNSFAFAGFSPEGRSTIEGITDRARARRPVHRVLMEVFDDGDDWARLVVDDGSGPREVGQAHPHGEWIELF
ncbi:MAG: DUF2332 domain-containing protein [Acidimicrobiia bacterium]